MVDPTITKDILKSAQDQIISLKKDNQTLTSDLESILNAQAHEAEQLVQMSEQLWKLEEALMSANQDKDVALMLLKKFQADVNRLRIFIEETLVRAREKKTTRLDVTVQVYEMKSMVDKLCKK